MHPCDYPGSRILRAVVLTISGALFVASPWFAVGCANPLQAARTTLVSVTRANSEAVDLFRKFDDNKQGAIVMNSATLAEGEAALAAYRAERVRVVQAFAGVYLATVALEKAIAFAEMGMAKTSSVPAVVEQLWDAFGKVKTALVGIGVDLGGL